MPRILNQSVFEMTVTDGVTKGDYFGYADGKDGDKYLGFKFGEQVFSIGVDEAALLIECETAAKYKAEHAKGQEASGGATGAGAANGTGTSSQGNGNGGSSSGGASGGSSQGGGQSKKQYKSFFGTANLNPLTGPIGCQNIYAELIQLFTSKPGVKVTVKLDITAETETGFDDGTVRAVSENSKVLKLESSEFNED